MSIGAVGRDPQTRTKKTDVSPAQNDPAADPTTKPTATTTTTTTTAATTTTTDGNTTTTTTTSPTGQQQTRTVDDRNDARRRFTSETGADFRRFQLQTSYTANGPDQDPPNSAPIGALSSATKTLTSPPPGVPTLGDVHRAIQGFSKDPNIPFSYVKDGCYARADAMAKVLEGNGIPTQKAWAFAQDPLARPLKVPGAEWGYHVAPQVKAWNPQTGQVGDYVIDPAMSGKPMTQAEWVAKMNPNNVPVQTRVTGTDAYVPDGHGGFLKANDPLVARGGFGPDQTMRNFGNERINAGLRPNAGPPDGIPSDVEVAASNTGKFARVGAAVTRGLGAVAAVGGGFQFANGVNEWQRGNKLDGGVDMTSGGLNVLGGAAMATGIGAPAAPFLFGASAMIDGGRDLYHGIQDGDTRKTVVGGAKMAGGGMMIAGGALCATGVGLPVGAALIVGGAVVAGGAAVYDAFHEQIDGAVSSAVNTVKDAASSVGNAISDGWKTVTSWF